MIQQEMLKMIEIQVISPLEAKLVERIIPLKQQLAFIYYENGVYQLYDINKQVITQKGQISVKIKFFLEIYTNVLIFHDPVDLQIKLLDLNMNQINPKFVFKSSDQIDIKSDQETKEIFLDRFRIFFIDCQKNQIKYLMSQDLEKSYSNNNVCHYTIRVLPLYYNSQTNFELTPVVKYDYQNSISQTELYNWQVDQETIAIYGQDSDNFKSEILLIKPHLMEQAFYIIHTKFECSYTTMNVTNWINPNQVAIWVNCDDKSTRPSIFCFDLRRYYNGKNWLPEPQFIATLARDEYINNEPQVFMDIFQFQLESTYVIHLRYVNYELKVSVINYENIQEPQVVSEFIVDSFWIQPVVDHSWILFYNDLGIQNQLVNFKILINLNPNPIHDGYYLLNFLEKSKIIEKYGIHVVEEIFEFYF
ncbi:unnamed protein product [Paramecium pentaurelia]|uniref:Uncharacterized protein n=1 Tax=Paramecium pentaurelia TaxID=43138 RepID=A0A8S1WUG5_9CILI|nr:unnamed protein product [Paramecium pentaurelia]